ncbi:MAG: hypothetical protein ABI333_23525 [bacterium]
MIKHLAIILGAAVLTLGLVAPAHASPAVVIVIPPPAPPATAAPPSTHPHYRPYRRYRPYRTYRPYRSYRPYRPYRSDRYRKSFHKKGGPYFGFGIGYFGLIKPEGAYRHLRPTVFLNPYFGWNLSPIFGLELGYSGALFKEQDGALGGVKNPSLFNVTLDLKVRLIQPTRRRYVVPYLRAGLGIGFLQGTIEAASECEENKDHTMALGGSIQVGGGLDIYLKPWLVLGARFQYRPLFMSGLKCGPGAGARCDEENQPFHLLHSFSADLSLTFAWPD